MHRPEGAERPSLPRVLALCGLAFAVLASYEVARPATKSLFVTAHGSAAEPVAWIFVALGSMVAVALYGRFAARLPLIRLLSACVVVSGALLVALQGALAAEVPFVRYALYVWRDVYIVVLIEAFWTFANTVVPLRSAPWVYGLFCAAGSLGSRVGAQVVEHLALSQGTATALWAVLPPLGLAWLGALLLARISGPVAPPPKGEVASSVREGLDVLRRSPYLVYLLLLVLVIQFVLTLADYRLSVAVETGITDPNQRTAAIATVFKHIADGALLFQLATGPVLRLLGVPGTLLAVPLLNLGVLGASAVEPSLTLVAWALVAGKVLDYSLFRAAKEILYIPLTYAEKTQGKALVDMLAYRVSKGVVALLLKALIALGAAAASGWIAVGAIAAWLGLTAAVVRRWRRRVAEVEAEEEAREVA